MNPRHVPADCRATCRRQSRQYPHNLVPATALDQRLDAVHNVLLHFLVLGSSLPPGGKNNEIEEIGAKAPQFACRLPARLRSAFLTLSIPAAHRAPHGQYVPFGAYARTYSPVRKLHPARCVPGAPLSRATTSSSSCGSAVVPTSVATSSTVSSSRAIASISRNG
jgi:hypothetical protein